MSPLFYPAILLHSHTCLFSHLYNIIICHIALQIYTTTIPPISPYFVSQEWIIIWLPWGNRSSFLRGLSSLPSRCTELLLNVSFTLSFPCIRRGEHTVRNPNPLPCALGPDPCSLPLKQCLAPIGAHKYFPNEWMRMQESEWTSFNRKNNHILLQKLLIFICPYTLKEKKVILFCWSEIQV